MSKQILSVKEAANFLKLSVSTVKRLADTGSLKCNKTSGGHRRFELRILQKFLAEMDVNYNRDFNAHKWFNLLLKESDPYILYSSILNERAKFGSWYKLADVFGDILYEIGQKWQEGDCSIIEEHIVTKRFEQLLASCISSIQIATDSPRCILLSVKDDSHTLGLSLAELCLREQGWLNVCLGTDVPLNDLDIFLKENKFEMVLVSASSWSCDELKLSKWYEEVADICKKYGSYLVLGGKGRWPKNLYYGKRFNTFEELAEFLKGL